MISFAMQSLAAQRALKPHACTGQALRGWVCGGGGRRVEWVAYRLPSLAPSSMKSCSNVWTESNRSSMRASPGYCCVLLLLLETATAAGGQHACAQPTLDAAFNILQLVSSLWWLALAQAVCGVAVVHD